MYNSDRIVQYIPLNIYIYSKTSRAINKRLTDYLRNNLAKIIKFNFRIIFNRVDEKMLASLSQQGVQTLPCLIFENNIYEGYDKITGKIYSLCLQAKQRTTSQPSSKPDPDSMIYDYQEKTLFNNFDMNGRNAAEEEDNENFEDMARKRMQEMMKQREMNGMHVPSGSESAAQPAQSRPGPQPAQPRPAPKPTQAKPAPQKDLNQVIRQYGGSGASPGFAKKINSSNSIHQQRPVLQSNLDQDDKLLSNLFENMDVNVNAIDQL